MASITKKHNKYLLRVNKAGHDRITKSCDSYAEAEALGKEIEDALDKYGKWPILIGSLREAAKLALATHWTGMRSHRSNSYCVWLVVEFFEARGKTEIDQIVSEDVDAIVQDMRQRQLSATYINQQLGLLRTINQVALKRDPPLATKTIPTPHLKSGHQRKWWLTPDDHLKATAWLREPGNNPLFADVIDIMAYQGLRVEETLRLTTRSFAGLDTEKPWLYPDGTKTREASNALAVYPATVDVAKRCIERAASNGWDRLFPLTPRQTNYMWNEVRSFLGASDVPTATMKSVRRTFAWYANNRKMPTATLQEVMRHKTITTTAGYLRLVGAGNVDASREYFSKPDPEPSTKQDIGAIIRAYASAPGVSPEDVARFAKELIQ